MQRLHLMSGGRYPVLRSLGILYLVGSVIAILSGLLAAGWVLLSAPASVGDRIAWALIALAGTFFLALTMCAIAEVLKLVIDIEHNTRLAAVNRFATPPSNVGTNDGGRMGMHAIDEETAETALLRGR